jgi:DUF1009 family protein
LVILAAGGRAPVDVAEAATAAGRDVFIIGLEGEVDEGIRTFAHATTKWGQIGRIEELIRAHGARDLVLIGSVTQRPDFGRIAVDFGALRYLPKLIKAMFGGDDTVLGAFAQHIEERGYRIVGVPDVAAQLVAAPGAIAGRAPDGQTRDDATLALAAARAIGLIDAGQAAVAVNGRIVALEAAEGTDAMLARIGELRIAGRVKWVGRTGVMAKCAKPQQDLRLDMPTIGARTVEAAAAAGLAGIVIEAGRVMLAERSQMVAAADRTSTFVFAVETSVKG